MKALQLLWRCIARNTLSDKAINKWFSWRKNIKIIGSISRENMHGYLFADVNCSEIRIVSFEEQMSKEHGFLLHRGYCVYYPSKILRRAWKKFKTSLLSSSWYVFCWGFSGTTLRTKKLFPFFCNNHKTLSLLSDEKKKNKLDMVWCYSGLKIQTI